MQCETYARLARESQSADEADGHAMELEQAMESDGNEDKTFAAMGVAKTITTVVNAGDSNPEILAQVQEIVIPIVKLTLEAKLLDLFDNMYDLVDALTFKLRSISPNMWPIFELTYKLFKSDAVDFLDGANLCLLLALHDTDKMSLNRDVALARQLRLVRC